MTEQQKLFAEWTNKQRTALPTDRFKTGDPILVHDIVLPDREAEFVAYGSKSRLFSYKQLVYICYNGEISITIEDELEPRNDS